jgi:hypothetical protein
MNFLLEKCSLFPLNNEILSQCWPFSCGDADLDDFFRNDVEKFDRQLLGKSFCYRLDENPSIKYVHSHLQIPVLTVEICQTVAEKN